MQTDATFLTTFSPKKSWKITLFSLFHFAIFLWFFGTFLSKVQVFNIFLLLSYWALFGTGRFRLIWCESRCSDMLRLALAWMFVSFPGLWALWTDMNMHDLLARECFALTRTECIFLLLGLPELWLQLTDPSWVIDRLLKNNLALRTDFPRPARFINSWKGAKSSWK